MRTNQAVSIRPLATVVPLTAHQMAEIEAPEEWIGRSVAEVGLRNRHSLNLIAARRGEHLHPVLDPAYIFVSGEHVLVLGSLDDIRKVTSD